MRAAPPKVHAQSREHDIRTRVARDSHEIRMRSHEVWVAPERRQVLFLGAVPLTEEQQLVAAAGVVPGARVFCGAGAAHDPEDAADALADGAGGAAPERGFAGTRLLGGAGAEGDWGAAAGDADVCFEVID